MSPIAAKRWRIAVSGLLVWSIAITVAGGFYLLSISHANNEVIRDHNSFVCITRKFFLTARARSAYQSRHAPTSTQRATASQAVASTDEFLANLITIPVRFDCTRVIRP